jgi:hypothetical protein
MSRHKRRSGQRRSQAECLAGRTLSLRWHGKGARFAEVAEVCHIGIPIEAVLVLQGVAADTLGFAATAPQINFRNFRKPALSMGLA